MSEIIEAIARGKQAETILTSPMYIEAMETLKGQIFAEWRETNDLHVREHLWLMGKVADRFEAILAGAMAGGQLAEAELEHIRGERNVIGM